MDKTPLRVGGFEVDPSTRELTRNGTSRKVDFKAMEVLLCLVERAGTSVTKDELLQTVWADRHVSENVVPVAVRTLRKALDDDANSPRYIETIPRVGYRLIAPVTRPEARQSRPQRLQPRRTVIVGILLAIGLAIGLTAFRQTEPPPPLLIDLTPIEVDDPALKDLASQIEERLISTLSREPSTSPRRAPSNGPAPAFVVSGSIRYRADRVAADRVYTDRIAADRVAADRVYTDRIAADRVAADRVYTDRIAADRIELSLSLTHQPSGTIPWSPLFESDDAEHLPEKVRQSFVAGAIPELRHAYENF